MLDVGAGDGYVFPNRDTIKVVVPEWDKLIEAGLYKVKD